MLSVRCCRLAVRHPQRCCGLLPGRDGAPACPPRGGLRPTEGPGSRSLQQLQGRTDSPPGFILCLKLNAPFQMYLESLHHFLGLLLSKFPFFHQYIYIIIINHLYMFILDNSVSTGFREVGQCPALVQLDLYTAR